MRNYLAILAFIFTTVWLQGTLGQQACNGGMFFNRSKGYCEDCPPGTAAYGIIFVDECWKCRDGFVAPNPGSQSCERCPSGSYAVNTTDCEPCPSGTFSDPSCYDPNICTSCETGTITSKPGSKSCDLCPAGTYEANNRTSCESCPSGTYSARGATDISECVVCPEGAPECSVCSKGSYQVGPNECAPCPVGTENPKTAIMDISGCLACPPGFISRGNSSECEPCRAGTYEFERRICDDCPSGTIAPHPAASKCASCPPGTNSFFGKVCRNCSGGYYEEDGECLSCPSGTASNATGAIGSSTCVPCLAGYIAPFRGNQECSKCPPDSVAVGGIKCQSLKEEVKESPKKSSNTLFYCIAAVLTAVLLFVVISSRKNKPTGDCVERSREVKVSLVRHNESEGL